MHSYITKLKGGNSVTDVPKTLALMIHTIDHHHLILAICGFGDKSAFHTIKERKQNTDI